MACFLVSAAEAAVVTVAAKAAEKNGTGHEEGEHLPFTRKLKWLSNMLWGGSALLAFEHVWHGEVVPWFPFLTAWCYKRAVIPQRITTYYEAASLGQAGPLLIKMW